MVTMMAKSRSEMDRQVTAMVGFNSNYKRYHRGEGVVKVGEATGFTKCRCVFYKLQVCGVGR